MYESLINIISTLFYTTVRIYDNINIFPFYTKKCTVSFNLIINRFVWEELYCQPVRNEPNAMQTCHAGCFFGRKGSFHYNLCNVRLTCHEQTIR